MIRDEISYVSHRLRIPNEDINQRNLKIWADVADKIWPYPKIWDWQLIFGRAVKAISSPDVRDVSQISSQYHRLRTLRQQIAFTAQPKIQSQSQIFRYGGSIFCLPHQPIFLDIFDLCLHWVSVVREQYVAGNCL